MSAFPIPRWAISFADLTMLLLAYFVLLHAADARTLVAAAHVAFPGGTAGGTLLEAKADAWFEPGEARLRPAARQRLAETAAEAGGRRLVIESVGRAPATTRFDGWELGAARAAAVARALTGAGVKEGRIDIVMPPLRAGAAPAEQRLTVRTAGN